MANGLIARNHATYVASASTSDVAYPAERIRTTSIREPWRSTTTSGTQYVQGDLGAAATLRVLHLANCNFSSVVIQTSDDPTFATGVTAQGTFAVDQDLRLEDPSFWRRQATCVFSTPR